MAITRSSRSSTAAVASQLAQAPFVDGTTARVSGKRRRQEDDENSDEPRSKRRAQTPTPGRTVNESDSQAPYTAPLPRDVKRRTFLGASRNTSKRPFISAASRIAQQNGYTGPSITMNSASGKLAQEGEEEKENITPGSQNISETVSPSSSPQNAIGEITDEEVSANPSGSQTARASFLGSMVNAAASPIKAFKAVSSWVMRPNANAQQSNETTQSDHATGSTTTTDIFEDMQNTQSSPIAEHTKPTRHTFRPDQMSLFSGRPSPYAVPASEAHLLPRPTHPKKLTQKEVEKRLKEKEEAIYKRNIEAGLASEEFQQQYRAEKEAEMAHAGQKRKWSTADHGSQDPKPGRFGLEYDESDVDEQSESSQMTTDSSQNPQTPPSKSRKTAAQQTPQRSAMKKNNLFASHTSEPRPAKSVNFNDNPVASTSYIPRYLGPAGVYTGTTFAEPRREKKSVATAPDADTSSTLEWSDIISPTTRQNTKTNALRGCEESVEYDPSYRDPSNPEWRPTPGRPRPTTFRVPFLDEEDPSFMQDEAEEEETTPRPPASPRPAHAALPAVSPSPTASISQENDGGLPDSSVSKLNKAREQAEKYKPKDSSRLSHVQQARSQSSSPPPSAATSAAAEANGYTAGEPPSLTTSPNGSEEERDHEWDEWARNLDWPAPVLRVDSGISSAYMENYITKHWGAEDDAQSEAFYQEEFRKLKEACAQAREMGVEVEFVRE